MAENHKQYILAQLAQGLSAEDLASNPNTLQYWGIDEIAVAAIPAHYTPMPEGSYDPHTAWQMPLHSKARRIQGDNGDCAFFFVFTGL